MKSFTSRHAPPPPRHRDKLRQAILEGLGWNIQHLWSTDWWHDPAAQTKKLLETLESLKAKPKTEAK